MFPGFRLRKKEKEKRPLLNGKVVGVLSVVAAQIIGALVQGRFKRVLAAALIGGVSAYYAKEGEEEEPPELAEYSPINRPKTSAIVSSPSSSEQTSEPGRMQP